MQYIVTYWGHTFGVLVEADIRRDLFSHLQTLSFGFYDKNRTGHLMSRMTAELFDITELAHHGPEDVFISGVTVVGAIAVHVHRPVAAGPGAADPDPPVPGGGVPQPPEPWRETSKRVKQTTAGINADIESSDLRHAYRQGLLQRGGGEREVPGGQRALQDLQAGLLQGHGPLQLLHGVLPLHHAGDGDRRGRQAHHGRADDLRGPHHLQPLHQHLHQSPPQALHPLGDAGQRLCGPAAASWRSCASSRS